MYKDQKGFSLLKILLTMGLLAITGFIGWSIWNANKDNDADLEPHTNLTIFEQSAPEQIRTSPKIPQNFREYKNEAYGFSFAYPEAVGDIVSADTQSNRNILVYEKSTDSPNTFSKYTQSPLYVRVDNVEGFVVGAKKYGPILELKDDKWIVSAQEGGDVNNGGYKIGSEYETSLVTTNNMTKVYDFSYQYEGCYRAHWLFKSKNSFTSIMLPAVCADEIGTIPQNRLDDYNSVAKQVLDTLFIK